MTQQQTVQEIYEIVWQACDAFRGAIDPADYKNYILTMLFVKYISDVYKDDVAKATKIGEKQKLSGEKLEEYIDAKIERTAQYRIPKITTTVTKGKETFEVSFRATFDELYKRREDGNIGELIDMSLRLIEEKNDKLGNVFGSISYNSEAALGTSKERVRRIGKLLELLNDERIDFRPSHVQNRDLIGDLYEYLIARFASGAGKKAGEFYTPAEVSITLARLVNPMPGETIYDPTCGSGSLLLRASEVSRDNDPERTGNRGNFYLYGQELNGSTFALCKMNMFLHQKMNFDIRRGNTITEPQFVEVQPSKDDKRSKGSLKVFDVVIANPPFSLDQWGIEDVENDPFNRFERGMPPKSKGDFAFISHMIASAKNGSGRVGVVVPHGVLFRGGSEGKIRTKFVEENLLEAVIGLPAKLFYGTGIPAALLIFDKSRKSWDKARSKRDKHVLFIDASKDYIDGKNQNTLGAEHIDRIVDTFRKFAAVERYSALVTMEELKEAAYNLNIPRFVDTFEEEEQIDLQAVQLEISAIESVLAQKQLKMAEYLQQLGLEQSTTVKQNGRVRRGVK